jgi:twitching motility protein PilU
VAAVEVMINSPHVQELIEEGKVPELDEAIKSSDKFYHMQSFNQSLAKLSKLGVISEADALANSTNPGDLRLMLRGVQIGSMGLSA